MQENKFLIYKSPDENITVNVVFKNETIWATKVLRNYMIKGFALDKERLKNGKYFGKDYFDELVEEIREIRASERRFYQKVTDIYATSCDYDKDSKTTRDFFSNVQNKLHYVVCGETAAELVTSRANSEKENIGLTSWKNSPHGKILKTDICVTKNYLSNKEIKELNRIVNMFLDYAEDRAQKQELMTMQDWTEKLDNFLTFNEREILSDNGKISNDIAKTLAMKEYEKFRVLQDELYESDFDSILKETKNKNNSYSK